MDFEKELDTGLEGRVVVMGIGNPMRGDDGAGSLVARRIMGLPGVSVIDAQDVPEDYMHRVVNQRPDTIVLIDSVDLDSAPGSVAFLEQEQLHDYWPSTHRLPVGLLMRILRHQTQARIIAIGIQPAHTRTMEPVSSAVAASVSLVAGILNRALARAALTEVPA